MKPTRIPGTVDLSKFKEGLVGPRERDTLMSELELMAQTRELVLRRQVELEQINEGYSRALSVLVDLYGEEDGQGKKFIAIPGDEFKRSVKQVVAFSMDLGRDTLHLVNTYRFDGKWTIEKREPTEEEKQTLPWFESPPEFLTVPGPLTAVVGTKRGMRVAEWVPR